LRGMYNNNSCHASNSKTEPDENTNDGNDIYFEETYSSDDSNDSNDSKGSNGSNDSKGSNDSI